MCYAYAMPRKIVPLVTGETYHLFNRGVDKRNIFSDKVDFFRFHKSLQLFNAENKSGSVFELSFDEDWINSQKPLVDIHAYCLLNNHFHLLLTQVVDNGISEFMKRVGGGYTSYFNERFNRSGSLFQGTFKRVLCESNEQFLYLAAYVNLNNKVHERKDFYLSSFDVYAGNKIEKFVKTSVILEQYKSHDSFILFSEKTASDIAEKRKADKEFNEKEFLE